MRLAWAFLKRDLQIALSYRSSFVFIVVGGFITLTVFHFMGATIGSSPVLAKYGTNYFSFALVGVVVATSLRAMQTSFAARIRDAQSDGSLEVLLSSPHSTFRVVASLAAYPIVIALGRALALLATGALVFGADLHVDPLAFGATMALSLVAFAALGLLS